MSAMDKMFADMILKIIPPEILAMVTPENLNRIQAQVIETLEYYQHGLAQIAGEQLEQRQILERIEANVCNGNSGKPGRVAGGKRIAFTTPIADGPGSGS